MKKWEKEQERKEQERKRIQEENERKKQELKKEQQSNRIYKIHLNQTFRNESEKKKAIQKLQLNLLNQQNFRRMAADAKAARESLAKYKELQAQKSRSVRLEAPLYNIYRTL
jgi:hypothetical protein